MIPQSLVAYNRHSLEFLVRLYLMPIRSRVASLIPSIETPSLVAKQISDRKWREYSLPKYLLTICKQATPHCIEYCAVIS